MAAHPQPDNRLSFMDQAGLHLLRATGRGQLMQMVWVYEHPVDFDGIRRLHQNFGYGLLGRRIERSPLPFGRHRWVSSLGPPSAIDMAEKSRPREALSDWLDERAAITVDPEWGPGWHLGVLPMTDGSTAVALVASHHLVDGVAGLLAVTEAALGSRRDLGYPLPRSRKRFRRAMSDLRETAKGVPEVARTLTAAVQLGLAQRHQSAPSAASKPRRNRTAANSDHVVVPVISLFVDLPQWDANAKSRNGTSYSLVAGVAAKLAERMQRCNADGTVTQVVALNDRTSLEDTRANAMLFAQVRLDPAPVTSDLTDARVALREALKTAREVGDPTLRLLPLVPFVPRRAMRRIAEDFLGTGAELGVSCSNLGDVMPDAARLDGTDAEYVMMRGVDQNVRRADLERAGGQLVVVAGRLDGKISISIVGYQVGAQNSKPWLRRLAADTLADFGLTAEIV